MNLARFSRLALGAFFTLLFAVTSGGPLVRSAGAAPETEGPSGRWFLDFVREDGRIQLSIERGSAGHHSQSSGPVRLEEFRDLKRPAGSAEVPARFSLVRDAGTFAFEGHLDSAGGSGRFRFVPSAEFASAWQSSGGGRGALSEEQIYAMAVHDVSRAFIQDLRGMGYERLPSDALVSMRIHGATPEFAREMKSLGYDRIPSDDLVSMRIHGVSPEWVREFQSLGYRNIAAEDLVSMRIHGVEPGFVRELQGLGYRDVPVDELVSMRIHGVTIEFVRQVQARDRNVSIDELVSRRIHGRG